MIDGFGASCRKKVAAVVVVLTMSSSSASASLLRRLLLPLSRHRSHHPAAPPPTSDPPQPPPPPDPVLAPAPSTHHRRRPIPLPPSSSSSPPPAAPAPHHSPLPVTPSPAASSPPAPPPTSPPSLPPPDAPPPSHVPPPLSPLTPPPEFSPPPPPVPAPDSAVPPPAEPPADPPTIPPAAVPPAAAPPVVPPPPPPPPPPSPSPPAIPPSLPSPPPSDVTPLLPPSPPPPPAIPPSLPPPPPPPPQTLPPLPPPALPPSLPPLPPPFPVAPPPFPFPRPQPAAPPPPTPAGSPPSPPPPPPPAPRHHNAISASGTVAMISSASALFCIASIVVCLFLYRRRRGGFTPTKKRGGANKAPPARMQQQQPGRMRGGNYDDGWQWRGAAAYPGGVSWGEDAMAYDGRGSGGLSASTSSRGSGGGGGGGYNLTKVFTYEEMERASGGFAEGHLIGEGGFGRVYKGALGDGTAVAIKQLRVGGGQGEKEFRAEVETISRVHHRHLVSLIGYCVAHAHRILVYQYVPNGTLDEHLHRKLRNWRLMSWPLRMKVAIGAARGLSYLHEDCHPRIIHRDIKSSNILLDNNFEALVSDFGLAKLTSDAFTHVTTRVMGTFGYLAPEYASSGKLTDKSDVYSFGVVLLELITGRKPVDLSQPFGEESIVEWARPRLTQISSELDLHRVADPLLEGKYDPKEMLRMVEIAAGCIKQNSKSRPRMGQVVRALEDDATAYIFGSDQEPSDYSGETSDYGLNPSISSNDSNYHL